MAAPSFEALITVNGHVKREVKVESSAEEKKPTRL
jgi:hypothetical protein